MGLVLQVAFEEPLLAKTASPSFVSSGDIATQFLPYFGKELVGVFALLGTSRYSQALSLRVDLLIFMQRRENT